MQIVKLSVTVKHRLKCKYGAVKLKRIRTAIRAWIKADALRGIRTEHVEVDDSPAMKKHGLEPVKLVDGKATPLDIKRAIDRLWKKITPTPDYLVLFGGCDIVPMFVVANPFDPRGDNDSLFPQQREKVPTDNPYASSLPFRSSDRRSYLVPDRVIGRIPDRVGSRDPAWLVRYLNSATKSQPESVDRYMKTYAICTYRASRAGDKCMKYIARPDSKLLLSPPTKDYWRSANHRLSARLHIIKCHGSPGDPKLYGQKWNHYPYAMNTHTLRTYLKPATVVATMCCYGAQIFSPAKAVDRTPKALAKALRVEPKRGGWPLASTYLRDGALGFVGPTVTTYAGDSEMMSADWIVAAYLNGILGGASIGRAFQESKQDYLRWLNQQGQAPGIDEELTLIEYVLLGDPSITPVTYRLSKLITPGHKIALGAEELQTRRVARARLARGLRYLLPKRAPATSAKRAMAKKLFPIAKEAAKEAKAMDIRRFKEFALKPSAVHVEKVNTPLLAIGDAKNAKIKSRQSLQYYWSGRRVNKRDGQEQICLLKAETDPKTGKLWRVEVIHSS
jgi:hypothetical protein